MAPRESTPTGAASSPPAALVVGEGERRHLTVLFTDLVGSTEIAARLDPEEWRDVLARYHQTAAAVVARYDGYVAQFLGDGVLVYFGWPTAHEDDAERAVRAGLAVMDAVATLNERFADERLAVRAGIDSGSVVVGHDAGGDPAVYGDTPNIAARVQALAEPGWVLMTGAVHDLVRERFVFEHLGQRIIKGVDRPLSLHRAVRPDSVGRRWRGARRLAPIVGREEEIAHLLARWERARAGQGQFVLVTGEPGIGKSRLTDEFRARIAGQPHLWIDCAGERFFENTPFHVVVQVLRQALDWRADDDLAERLGRLRDLLADAGVVDPEAAPAIGELLAPPDTKGTVVGGEPGGEGRRRRLLSTLGAWLLGLSRRKPLVIVMEDLHWVDPSSLELAGLLVDQVASSPLLFLVTTRRGQRVPWPMRAHCTEVGLSRLSDSQTQELIRRLNGPGDMGPDVIDALVARADGVPLFAEALTRLVVDGGRRASGGRIPATLHDSLTAALDRLGPAREVARVAAVLGREFSHRLLAAVSPGSARSLEAALAALVDADLIYARGQPPEAVYRFRHALIQDAAYEGLLRSRRRELHREAARALSALFPAMVAAQPQILARHLTLAGDVAEAASAWKVAGDAAHARRAFKEAEDAYRQARAALASTPHTPRRDRSELDLCAALVEVQQQTRGYSAPETVETALRARALADIVGDAPQRLQQAVRNWSAVFATGDYAGSAALADGVRALAEDTVPFALREAFSHHEAVQTCFYTGDLAGLERHGASLAPLLADPSIRHPTGNRAMSTGLIALGDWFAGRDAAARQGIERGLDYAERSQRPYDLVLALLFEAYLHRFRKRPGEAEQAAKRMLDLSDSHGFSYASDLARGVLGWAWSHSGRAEAGAALIREAMAGMSDAGAKVGLTDVATRLAEAEALGGDPDAALETIDRALTLNAQERIFRPNALVARGQLRSRLGDATLAIGDFQDAFALAQDMGAWACALRAAIALGHENRRIGDLEAARTALALVSMTVGFDGFGETDAAEARALLASLGG